MISASGLYDVSGSPEDVAHAQLLLRTVGAIPLTDLAGHRGAVQMWRDHCAQPPSSAVVGERLARVLAEPRFDLVYTYWGQAPDDRLALFWVAPGDIVLPPPPFPYHHTVEGLAGIATRVLAENGDPDLMDVILGRDFGLQGVFTANRPLLAIGHNGNHRAAALRAAGFPAVLAHVRWVGGPFSPPLSTEADRARLQLFLRYGLAHSLGSNRWGPTVHVTEPGDSVLFDLRTPADIEAFEAVRGRQPWPSWLRSRRMYNRELRRIRRGRWA